MSYLIEYLVVFPAWPRQPDSFLADEARYRAHAQGFMVDPGPVYISRHNRLRTVESIVIVGVPVRKKTGKPCFSAGRNRKYQNQ